jgi:DNA-directed RNA polymerase specialized sigma subunit
LSDKELMILYKRLKEVPVERIAKELGVSSSRVSQLARRAVKKFCEEPRKEPRHGDD